MAQKIVHQLIDDIDGSEADQSIEFTWEGHEYRIDLNEKNADKFRKAIAPYLGSAQRVGGRARRGKAPATRSPSNAAEVRAWAIENNYEVPERGRIPNDIRVAFDEVNA
ncbi:MAG TPA: Lsr2 family protein [Kineosporiaceae bacterium]|nr:Lsr2 family protein [Kineosporiaceae bacterium]